MIVYIIIAIIVLLFIFYFYTRNIKKNTYVKTNKKSKTSKNVSTIVEIIVEIIIFIIAVIMVVIFLLKILNIKSINDFIDLFKSDTKNTVNKGAIPKKPLQTYRGSSNLRPLNLEVIRNMIFQDIKNNPKIIIKPTKKSVSPVEEYLKDKFYNLRQQYPRSDIPDNSENFRYTKKFY